MQSSGLIIFKNTILCNFDFPVLHDLQLFDAVMKSQIKYRAQSPELAAYGKGNFSLLYIIGIRTILGFPLLHVACTQL